MNAFPPAGASPMNKITDMPSSGTQAGSASTFDDRRVVSGCSKRTAAGDEEPSCKRQLTLGRCTGASFGVAAPNPSPKTGGSSSKLVASTLVDLQPIDPVPKVCLSHQGTCNVTSTCKAVHGATCMIASVVAVQIQFRCNSFSGYT